MYSLIYLLYSTYLRHDSNLRLSFVFGRQYHWNETQTGASFFGLGSGSLLGLLCVYWWSDRISVSLTKKHGESKPEVLTVWDLM